MGNGLADWKIAPFVRQPVERQRGHFYRRTLQEASCLLL